MPDVASSPLERIAESEREYLLQFRRGDTGVCDAAFEALFRLHQRPVRGWILRVVRDAAAADELTIETFWRIYRARERFEPERGFEPWARRIATRVALDWLRAQKPEYTVAEDFFIGSTAKSTSDPAIADEIRRRTAMAFARLPPTLRIAAVLAVVEERPYKEVAEALGISVTAVKLRVFRALRLLRKGLRLQGIVP